jgi:spore coat protein U-like protein
MKSCWTRLLLAIAMLLATPFAQAAITCTIASPGVSLNYVNNTTTNVQTFFSVSCTRTSTSDPGNVNYDVLADNGGNPNGQNNRAVLGGTFLRYDVFTSSACNTTWKGNRKISDSISWSNNATGTITKQTSFWGCIITAQTVTNSGTYTDTVGVQMTYGANSTVTTGIVPVAIFAPALCTMTTPPSNLQLTYAAFGALVSKNTTFAVTCTNGMPYTITTDVPEGVITGLRYLLSLSAIAATGSGAAQSYTVTATIPGGQAGSCATGVCNATNTHTLTISY